MRKHKTVENSWRVIAHCHVNGDGIVLMTKHDVGYLLRVYHGDLNCELQFCEDRCQALKQYRAASHAAIERLLDSE